MTIVFVLWWILLAVAVVVVLPLVWYLLHRIYLAASNIERYASETLTAGVGILNNTRAVQELRTTRTVAGELLRGAESIGESAGAIEQALRRTKMAGGSP
jgi:hypothetical protein